MKEVELLTELGLAGIKLEADGERLRYYPLASMTPALLEELKAHKGELLTLLQTESPAAPESIPIDFDDPWAAVDKLPASNQLEPNQFAANACDECPEAVCRCGSTTWRDVPIHDGQSARRDCGRCGRFIGFSRWYGEACLQNEKHPPRMSGWPRHNQS